MPYKKGNPKPPGSGMKRGMTRKLTEEVRKLAREHGPETIAELHRILTSSPDDKARILAGQEILNRAYGKSSPLPLEEDGKAGALRVVIMGDDAKL